MATDTVNDLASYQNFALQQQQYNNEWSAKQAQITRDWQAQMSNTAHQREVADLKAAGLNPILSANSGASVPSGATGETDNSAAGNVGAILQQVLQAQSAREVAAMYNAATINAASIAANASMYGSDMSYWNSEDHPKSMEEVGARTLWNMTGAESNHTPNSGNTGPHSSVPGKTSDKAYWQNLYSQTKKRDLFNQFKIQPINDKLSNWSRNAMASQRFLSAMNVRTRMNFLQFLQKRGFKDFKSAMNSGLSNFMSMYLNFVKSARHS